MQKDAHLLFEGWKDKILPAALALGVGAPVGNYIGNKLKEPEWLKPLKALSDKEKYDYASMAYQDAVFLNGNIDSAAKLYVYYSLGLDKEAHDKLKSSMLGLDKQLDPVKKERAKKLRDAINYQIKQWRIKQWADEDAEKVETEPYLNNANDEETLTQYQQAWQGAGGGYGKGYMSQG